MWSPRWCLCRLSRNDNRWETDWLTDFTIQRRDGWKRTSVFNPSLPCFSLLLLRFSMTSKKVPSGWKWQFSLPFLTGKCSFLKDKEARVSPLPLFDLLQPPLLLISLFVMFSCVCSKGWQRNKKGREKRWRNAETHSFNFYPYTFQSFLTLSFQEERWRGREINDGEKRKIDKNTFERTQVFFLAREKRARAKNALTP